MDILQRRTDGLIVQNLDAEAVIYDERSHQAFCLSAPSKAVWLLCNGVSRAQVLSRASAEYDLTPDAISQILTELEGCGILSCRPWPANERAELPLAEATRHSRRAMVQKLAAGAVMTVPFIAAIVAPPAALAYTGCTVKVGGVCVLGKGSGAQAQQRHVRRRSVE